MFVCLTVSCKRLQQQEAALQVQVAHLTLQNMELRRELGSGWSAAEPNVMQVSTRKQLQQQRRNSLSHHLLRCSMAAQPLITRSGNSAQACA